MVSETVSERSAAQPGAEVLVASNRGPVSYAVGEGGALTAKRGGGGLVSGLSAIGPDTDAVWVCAALGEGDREAVRRTGGELDPADTGGQRVRMLDIPADVYTDAYNGIANSVLWFVHHMLYQTPLEPAFDTEFRAQWASYEAYNAAFADALAQAAAPGAAVLVQDYHLALVPGLLRERRPDLRIAHFSHTPWAPAEYFALLPDDIQQKLVAGILGADWANFLTRHWARAFMDCCQWALGSECEAYWPPNEDLDKDTDGDLDKDPYLVSTWLKPRKTRIGVHGLGADAEFLRERAYRPDVEERLTALREQIGGADRRTIVRVDRTELSKNIVRGLLAYRRLLADRPEWHERVVHIAFAYPSRQDLAVYRAYTEEVGRLAEEINTEYGTARWQPVVLHVKDDFARSLAAYRLADVALVNPIRDGMNLVAKEVPVVSERGCALVLSRGAGAYWELREDALVVNPYDITETAQALHEALSMDDTERATRSARLATAATALPPTQWFLNQLRALRES